MNLKTEIGKFYKLGEFPQELSKRLNENFIQFVLPDRIALHNTHFNFAEIKMARYYYVHLFLDDEGNVYEGCLTDEGNLLNKAFNIAEVWEDGTYRPDGKCYLCGYRIISIDEKMDWEKRSMPACMWISEKDFVGLG